MAIEIEKLTISSAAAALDAGEISSVELAKAYLDRAKSADKNIRAFLTLDEAGILAQAEASDKRRTEGKPLGPFDGVPVALKDNIVETGQTCSCASKILKTVKSPYDATVTTRMKEQGLVLFGRTNLDEFAMGSSCENSGFFPTANPWDTERVPGGSSGGSAAAVSARLVPAALGSDTGGSIRQPASFCGTVGLKPTYGRVSRYGLVAFASSLDQIGPLTNSVEDAAALLDIIGGKDPKDATSLPEPCKGFTDAVKKISVPDLSGMKIGLPKEYFELEGLDSGVKGVTEAAVASMKAAGAEIVDVSLPHTKYAIAAYYIIAPAEASANLARFDGIRYGTRDPEAHDLMSTYFKTRGKYFGAEVKRRIILGTYVLSSGYYDAYYLRAQKVRTLIRNDFEQAFSKCDALLTPVAPVPAFKFGEKSDPLQMYLADVFTIAVNLAGIPGISVPADLHPETGTPVGVQFLAPSLGEEKLLTIARNFELCRARQEFVPGLG